MKNKSLYDNIGYNVSIQYSNFTVFIHPERRATLLDHSEQREFG